MTGNNFLIRASGQRLKSVNYKWCQSHLPWGAFMHEAIREIEWTAADDFNIANSRLSVPLSTAGCDNWHVINCVCQKQQFDALTLFIDFATHTNPMPTAESVEMHLYNLIVSTLVQIWRELKLLFVDIFCQVCAKALAKCLTSNSRTFVSSWTGAIFIRTMCIKRAYLATDVLLWICGPPWIQMSE